jgi:hypothetical protein
MHGKLGKKAMRVVRRGAQKKGGPPEAAPQKKTRVKRVRQHSANNR